MVNICKFNQSDNRFIALKNRKSTISDDVKKTVTEILENVKEHGDEALFDYMSRFDGVDIKEIGISVTSEEFEEAERMVSDDFKEAVKKACQNIFCYHENQIPQGYIKNLSDGVILERRYRPIENIAVTIPGNMGPLVSSLYMSVIPALVAKVPNIYILTKPQKNGKINEHLLYVAKYLGVENVYKISGAQGIAAVAYGTESIKKVDAIFGPGNQYTQIAKKMLYGDVKIDFIAGPSEIAIIADETSIARYVAGDMLSQAEHGTGYEASTVFCTSEKKAREIGEAVDKLIEEYNLQNVEKSLVNYGDIFIVDSIDDAIMGVNEIAPEHAEIMVDSKIQDSVLDRIVNAGAVFVGDYSSEPVGDYYCGTNHVLPTCGSARFSSGLSVLDYIRGYSIIKYSKEALKKNHENIEKIALIEGMKAHAMAVSIRND